MMMIMSLRMHVIEEKQRYATANDVQDGVLYSTVLVITCLILGDITENKNIT